MCTYNQDVCTHFNAVDILGVGAHVYRTKSLRAVISMYEIFQITQGEGAKIAYPM